jgi:acyl carrier protein
MDHAARIQEFCRQTLASILEIEASDITAPTTFTSLGLDSASAVHFILALEQETDLEFDPDVLYDYPSLDVLSAYVAQLMNPEN